jgi:pimeloyl-ACP methyl ester carboxylesterase
MQNLESTSEGFRWRANLDAIDSNHDFILGFPDFPSTARFEGPTFFISGALSHYVKDQDHPSIQIRFPNAEFHQLAGSGHWLHADNPQGFITELRGFLSRHQEVFADL